MPFFQAAARRERLRLLESAEQESSPEAAAKLLATARALAYLGAARFTHDVDAEVSERHPGLDSAGLQRLLQNSGPRPLDTASQARPMVEDVMSYDSDGGAVLPFQLRAQTQPDSPTGDNE